MAAFFYVDPDVVGGDPSLQDGTENEAWWANAYPTLNAAETARDADITGLGVYTFKCRGVTLADAAAANIFGWTTTAADYVYIYIAQANRHAGKWDTTKYRLSVASATPFSINEEYVRVAGLQSECTDATASQKAIRTGSVGASDIRFSNCIARTFTDTTTFGSAFYFSDLDTVVTLYNCVGHARGDTDNVSECAFYINVGTATLLNCTGCGGKYGYNMVAGTIALTNCIGLGAITADFRNGAADATVTYCASEDATADDWGGAGNITGCAFTFVDAANTNFHLAAADVSGAKDGGTDLSGTFEDDIDGVERAGDWDIGADEYVAAGGAISGSSSGSAIVSGTLKGAGKLAGTATAAATASGALKGSGKLIGTSAGTGIATATAKGAGKLIGTSAGLATVAGTTKGSGKLSGTAAGIAILDGILKGIGKLAGISDGTATVNGTIKGAGALIGLAAGFATVSGTLTLPAGAMTGTASGTAIVTGVLKGTGKLAGAAAGLATASAHIIGQAAISGVAAGVASVSGTVKGAGALIGTSAGVAVATGTVKGAGKLLGLSAGLASVTGTLIDLNALPEVRFDIDVSVALAYLVTSATKGSLSSAAARAFEISSTNSNRG